MVGEKAMGRERANLFRMEALDLDIEKEQDEGNTRLKLISIMTS